MFFLIQGESICKERAKKTQNLAKNDDFFLKGSFCLSDFRRDDLLEKAKETFRKETGMFCKVEQPLFALSLQIFSPHWTIIASDSKCLKLFQ